MSSFPEEPLNLSPSEGGGYYPAVIHQKLNGDKYEIVRKLGYGPRSSTWLALRVDNPRYVAVKIFTVAASEHAKTGYSNPQCSEQNRSCPGSSEMSWRFLGGKQRWIASLRRDEPIEQLRAKNQRLPVHAVQRIVYTVSCSLKGLHGANIMHGRIKAENVYFTTGVQIEYLKPVLDSEPAPTTLKINNYTTILSQPLPHSFKWNNKQKIVVDWPLQLHNLGHAQQGEYKPEKNEDYLSAPETLLQEASCSPQTDIWMLGCLTFNLLTGNAPFYSNGNTSKQIGAMCAALEDDAPEEWLSDNKMKNYNAEDHGLVTSLEAGLSDALHEDEAAAASAFIKGCLRLDPQKRFMAEDCLDHEWLEMANACSCMFH
ncbi:kinase-like protein [Phlegmacium glaucopus]|nr:kinase-like protein [Phlegmacium glaucopus]